MKTTKFNTMLKHLISATVLGLSAFSGSAHAAENLTNRPITLVVGFSAGSVTDVLARKLAERMNDKLGKTIIVDNKPGAGATIAASSVARAAPDGHTLLMTAIGHALAPSVYDNLPYDTQEDFKGVSRVATGRVLVIAHPNVSANDLREFITDAKNKPGHYTYGSSGLGTFMHVGMEMLSEQADVELLHIPYRSGTEAINAVLSGHVDITLCSVPNCTQQIEAGQLKALGFIGPERSPLAPEIPSTAELGLPDFDVSSYNLLLAPSGTPEPIIQALYQAVDEIVRSPEFAESTLISGFTPTPSTNPQEVDQFIADEIIYWQEIIGRSMKDVKAS